MKLRRLLIVPLAVALAAGLTSCTDDGPLRVGAIYPLSGTQGSGGIEELRGVLVAADLANQDGGVDGRLIEVRRLDVPAAEAAPGAIRTLAEDGIDLVLGSYGSTISSPAAVAAAGHGSLFWETGAVGKMAGVSAGELVFRVAPTGGILGRSAIEFVADQLAGKLGEQAAGLRYAVTAVDDVYGHGVAEGALAELRERGYEITSTRWYDPRDFDAAKLVAEVGATHPDVVFVVAYLEDGVAIRREQVRQRLPLVASIGTSSSYCMPAFGDRLGEAAVGLFASDKPDTHGINPNGLRPEAQALLERADAAYSAEYGESMTAPALAGFSGAWALFHHVLPRAGSLDAQAVARAAREVEVPRGGLPNGSGLEFGDPGTPDAGANLRAASVIWEWTRPGHREVVWPPEFARAPIQPLSITP